MPYNGSGTYNLPAGNPVVSGTTIQSTWANTTLTDVANALSQVLVRDGEAAMTGNLPMGGQSITNALNGTFSGSVTTGNLVLTSSSIPANGEYLPAANTIGWSTNGTQRATINATGNFIVNAPSSGAAIQSSTNTSTFNATGNSSIALANASVTAQTPLDFFTAGSLSGRIRNDYAGNMNYVAIGTGEHAFWDGGDSGVGSLAMTISGGAVNVPNGQGSLSAIYSGIPPNSQSANYSLVAADSGRCIYFTATGKTLTIPNGLIIGHTSTIINGGGTTTTISCAGTLYWSPSGATGSRTLAAFGVATVSQLYGVNIWVITGTGLS